MRRSSKHVAPRIQHDPQEHARIRLEHNLRNSETAIHLSSASESDAGSYLSQDDVESVEYPRHNSAPAPFDDFPSFDRRREYTQDEDIHGHPWSYRTGDDYEEGVNPYAAETMSTFAHHASAITLSAGLGGRGTKRDASMSGAEYDPDRPVDNIIAGVHSKLSVFDSETSRSRRLGLDLTDPLVAEDTEELDRILESGHAPASMHSRSVRVASPVTSGSSSHSDTEHFQQANSTIHDRPKLSDALRNVALSPKRPRSPLVTRSHTHSPQQQTVPIHSRGNSNHNATPRPQRRNNIFPSYGPTTHNQQQSQPQQPEVRLHPATPSEDSKFTKMARGLAKEIEDEKGQLKSSLKRVERTQPTSIQDHHNVFQEAPERERGSTSRPSARNRSRVQLPDVTGLTNAIESPEKMNAEYYAYRAEDRLRETENRLVQTLNSVQKKLQRLEDENSISRRRVRELELELEDCKREVVRERTRLIQQEDSLHEPNPRVKGKGKGRAMDLSAEASRVHDRYKEAVEEKKALEALINELRTHLARLTSELSSHRELLTELRTLRNADAKTLRDKGAEVTRLKNEVERLAGEVEVLRGVVEEGLRERRAAKEASLQHSDDHLEDIRPKHPEPESDEFASEDEAEEESDLDAHSDTEDVNHPFLDPPKSRLVDRTMRTDHATIGSSQSQSNPGLRFMNSRELDEIAEEIEERRSEHSGTIELSQFSPTRSPAQSPSPRSRSGNDFDISLIRARRALSPISAPEELGRDREQGHDNDTQSSRSSRRHKTEVEAPFPKIRGERLERMFFSAPEHDARTCTTCNRDRQQSRKGSKQAMPRHGTSDSDDEGFAEEGGEDHDYPRVPTKERRKRRERSIYDIDEVQSVARQEGLPPQTVVARIVRELEDDFTHYKSIYIELADQYKEMDGASNKAKRNMLAKHLREVVDVLEQKGDQISAMYDSLSFKVSGSSR